MPLNPSSGPGTPASGRIARAFSGLPRAGLAPTPRRVIEPLFETDAVQGVIADTNSANLNAYYRSELLSTAIGGKNLIVIYENDVTSDGHRVTNDIAKIDGEGNPNASIAVNYLIQLIEEHGVVAGGSQARVMLDFESTFLYPWLEGYDTDENEALSVQRLGDAIDALRAHFGPNVLLSMWGMPAIPYYEIVGKSAEYRLAAIADVVARFLPLVRKFDFIVPSTYDYWADTQTMDPTTRQYVVTCTGTQAALLSDVSAFEAKWEEANLARQANVTCALECAAQGGRSAGVYPSYWLLFTPSSSLCISADHEGQFIPLNLILKDMATHINRPGVAGYHLWMPVRGFAGRAFTSASGTNEWRDGIVNAFYGGVSPVPDTYANWAVSQFRYDWAIQKYNPFVLSVANAIATIVR